VVLPSEPSEFRDDVRRLFLELDRLSGEAPAGECAPPLDVVESDHAVEITMDLPGVSASAVRIVARAQTVIIAGYKSARRTRGDSSFHLVERGYGRFARSVRLSASCDTSQAQATLANGELRISVPRIAERRGRTIRITIAGESPSA
jgi:HSP20 family protein